MLWPYVIQKPLRTHLWSTIWSTKALLYRTSYKGQRLYHIGRRIWKFLSMGYVLGIPRGYLLLQCCTREEGRLFIFFLEFGILQVPRYLYHPDWYLFPVPALYLFRRIWKLVLGKGTMLY